MVFPELLLRYIHALDKLLAGALAFSLDRR